MIRGLRFATRSVHGIIFEMKQTRRMHLFTIKGLVMGCCVVFFLLTSSTLLLTARLGGPPCPPSRLNRDRVASNIMVSMNKLMQ